MITKNGDIQYGLYTSQLKDYAKRHYNHDGTRMIYTDRFGPPAFTITHPSEEYCNCSMIKGYPHFQIPFDVCLEEIMLFNNNYPLYQEDYCVRFGDTHPDKPIPKLGQMRNVFLGDSLSSLISTAGKKVLVYGVGDVSEKTISRYTDAFFPGSTEICNTLIREIMNPGEFDGDVLLGYKSWSMHAIEKQIKPFLDTFHVYPELLLESELYYDRATLGFIQNNLTTTSSVKENGNIKYCLQELMFLLNMRFKEFKIISILGDSQSDHVSKVLAILNSNNINIDAGFLKYGNCVNALESDEKIWEKTIQKYIDDKCLLIDDIKPDYEDLLRVIVCATRNNGEIDFLKFDSASRYFKMISLIVQSLRIADSRKKAASAATKNVLPWIGKMALIYQEMDIAINAGEQGKFFDYLYSLASDYISNSDKNAQYSEIYETFMRKALHMLALDKSSFFKKI